MIVKVILTSLIVFSPPIHFVSCIVNYRKLLNLHSIDLIGSIHPYIHPSIISSKIFFCYFFTLFKHLMTLKITGVCLWTKDPDPEPVLYQIRWPKKAGSATALCKSHIWTLRSQTNLVVAGYITSVFLHSTATFFMFILCIILTTSCVSNQLY